MISKSHLIFPPWRVATRTGSFAKAALSWQAWLTSDRSKWRSRFGPMPRQWRKFQRTVRWSSLSRPRNGERFRLEFLAEGLKVNALLVFREHKVLSGFDADMLTNLGRNDDTALRVEANAEEVKQLDIGDTMQ